jgi:DNA-directed RNA polymerase II subunit RPB2
MNSILQEDDYFSVIEKYFNEKGPVCHQFESYEYMVNNTIQKIIDECPFIAVEVKNTKYKAAFGQIYIEKASLVDETTHNVRNIFPSEARVRDITYDCPVFVDINEEFWEFDEKYDEYKKTNELNHKKVFLMKVPAMVRSNVCNLYGMSMDECVSTGECSNDPGGYFIINGKERALVCQERLNYNHVYVFDANDVKNPYVAEIRSMSEETGHSVLIQAKMNRENKNIMFSLPYMSKEVYAGAVFKSLGFNSDDILKFVNPSTKEELTIVHRIIRESIQFTNKEKAIKYISSASLNKVEDDEERRIIYTQQVIENEMFPHMGISTALEKAMLLGDMLNKLIRVCLKIRTEDDRDNISLKRIEGPGVLISDLFRMCLKRYCDNIKKYLEKRQDIITAMSRTNNITSSLKHVFSTGNWAVQKNSYVRTGVSQIMSRLTYPATISHLRRVIIPIGKEGKNVKIRQIHPTQAFFVDIIESPEGKSIGIVKNLALSTNITTGCNFVLVKELVETCENFTKNDKFFERTDWYKVYVNGALLGLSDSPHELLSELREMRKNSIFSSQVSFYCEDADKEIRVLCDHGRFIRPVMTVENNKLLLTKDMMNMTWNELVDNDIIRYIDCNEVENSVIAMYPSDLGKIVGQKYDYCEIHPTLMLGVCSAIIPYPEHNQNPRLVYQSSMVKQALGVYSLAFKERFDTVTHVLHYPQKPIVSTKYDKMLKYDEMLTGCNPIVAILTYGGWNQEDSVMLNKSSVDRGMFVHTCYKTMQCEENKKTNCSFEKIEVPPAKCQNKTMNYSKLGINGVVPKGTPVYKGDVLIGKVLTKVQKDEEEDKTECSIVIGNGEEGIVDEIWDGFNDEGDKMIKVRIRQLRTPEVGDKLASRSSQKGVCGLLLTQEDMPFTQQGIVPDIMINPNCFTSDNKVSFYNGLAKKIKNMSKDEYLWTYEYNKKGLIMAQNAGMEWKGFKNTIKVFLKNGRTVKCTPDHKFYTSEGEWVEAKDLNYSHKIKMGIEGVEDINYNDEEKWTLNTLSFKFSCTNEKSREKSMAFARILGYLLSDGCICQEKRNPNQYVCPINFGHLIDAQICLKDIELVTNKTSNILYNKSNVQKEKTYNIYLPSELGRSIALLDGITIGRRTLQDTTWPSFLFSSPKSIVREFLGGLFGGDGHAPYLSKTTIFGVKFSQSTIEDKKDKFELKMNKLCDLLNMFDVDAKIERVRVYKQKDKNYNSYYIKINNTLEFSRKIGFRYCTEKMCRLSIYKSYKEFRENVINQSQFVLKKYNEYNDIEKAREELVKNEPVLNEYYSLVKGTNKFKSSRSKSIINLNYKHFPLFTEYIKNIGCEKWFSSKEYIIKRDVMEIPTYYMGVSGIRESEKEDVYCIGVEKYHNFICEGSVVRNCMPSRMTMSQLIETLLGKTCSLEGKLGDSTGFSTSSIDPTNKICEDLKMLGFERHGNEKMYCGYTGEMLEAEVFIGPTYYQRLKHLVRDKIHSRSRGNVTMMHHQPSEGRSRDGGLRTGEMERDSLIAHGGSAFIKETFFDMSDVYQVNVCEKCGGIISSAKECRACKKMDIAKVNIPYCTKLLFQELQAMGVSININVK